MTTNHPPAESRMTCAICGGLFPLSKLSPASAHPEADPLCDACLESDNFAQKMVALQDENTRLTTEVERLRGERDAAEQHKQVLGHALDCVDRVFQAENGKPPPILPDFCQLGESKFAACVRLAEAYRDLQAQLTGRDMPTSPPTETPAAAVRCFRSNHRKAFWAMTGENEGLYFDGEDFRESSTRLWELIGSREEIPFPAALALLDDRPEQQARLKQMGGQS